MKNTGGHTGPPDSPPRWLWLIARFGFPLLLVGIAIVAVLVGGGVATPYCDMAEVIAGYPAQSTPNAAWRATFNTATDSLVFEIEITADGYYRLRATDAAPLSEYIAFPHIRPVGNDNALCLGSASDGVTVVYINREIAWQGKLTGRIERLRIQGDDVGFAISKQFLY